MGFLPKISSHEISECRISVAHFRKKLQPFHGIIIGMSFPQIIIKIVTFTFIVFNLIRGSFFRVNYFDHTSQNSINIRQACDSIQNALYFVQPMGKCLKVYIVNSLWWSKRKRRVAWKWLWHFFVFRKSFGQLNDSYLNWLVLSFIHLFGKTVGKLILWQLIHLIKIQS